MNSSTTRWLAGDRALPWLIGALLIVIAPHALRQPPWVSVVFAMLATWRAMAWLKRWPLPNRRNRALQLLKNLVAVAVFVVVFVKFGGRLGRDAGIALLMILAGLKLLELQKERDGYIVCFLGYFLVVTNFLYTQTISTAAVMGGAVILITTALATFNDKLGAMSARARVTLVLRMLAQTVPLMVVLFVLFPRLPGPLWGLPQTGGQAVSGLSDELTLGNISELSLSDEIAFRVDFDGELPKPKQLYWRGPVLWFNDGRSWSAGSPPARLASTISGSGLVKYTVTLEPHEKRWLFGLDLVTQAPDDARITADYRIVRNAKLRRRLRYSMTSMLDYQVTELPEDERTRALQLPRDAHPQAREFAQQLRREQLGDEAIAMRVLRMFREQAFFYTLRPPIPIGDPVDDFLFNARRGFCEHFAASFTVLMRAAGIPARLVTGYQGGEYNPVGEFLTVRQRDAHAWAEIWLEGAGWVRFDPTAAVAPQRIDLGIDTVLPRTGGVLDLAFSDSELAQDLMRRLSNFWGAAGNAWNQWILGYSMARQRRLLERLGFEKTDWLHLGFAISAAMTAIFIILALLLARGDRRPTRNAARRHYDRFCAKLARAGIHKEAHEGPLDFMQRASALRADLAASIEYICQLYMAARYGEDEQAVPVLARAVRRFSPGRS